MDFIQALHIRAEQRHRYLENPNFERLSDIFSKPISYYGKGDNHLFAALLYGPDKKPSRWKINSDSYDELEQLFLEQYKRKTINWNGIYQYYIERQKTLDNNQFKTELKKINIEINTNIVLKILEKYKTKILATYKTF